MIQLTFTSDLPVDRSRLWQAVTAMDGINDEMRHWLSMGAPPGVRDLQAVALTPGKPLFRSESEPLHRFFNVPWNTLSIVVHRTQT